MRNVTAPLDRPVSVVVPFHNEETYIGEALESIFAQNHANIEVLAVDDGSTDNGADIVQTFGPQVKLITQTNQGTAAALNRGVASAQFELIAFLDADDRWSAQKLQLQCEALDSRPDLDFVLAQMRNFPSPELCDAEREGLLGLHETIIGNCPGTMLIRREALAAVGEFSVKWRVGEYLEWFIRAQEKTLNFSVIKQVLLHRRIHSGNKGRTQAEARVDYLSIIKEALARKKRVLNGRDEI